MKANRAFPVDEAQMRKLLSESQQEFWELWFQINSDAEQRPHPFWLIMGWKNSSLEGD